MKKSMLAVVAACVPAVALAQDMPPMEGSEAASGQPTFGIGVSNQLNLLASNFGFSGAIPFSTLTAKAFIGDRMAAEGDLGLLFVSPETGDSQSVILIGGKFHYIVHRLAHSHFFVNGGFHIINFANSLVVTTPAGPASGDAFVFNFGVNAGWEYIFTSGLPGLGISPEFGFNFSFANPEGDGNNQTAIQLDGYGQEFPFLLMNIRYYFM